MPTFAPSSAIAAKVSPEGRHQTRTIQAAPRQQQDRSNPKAMTDSDHFAPFVDTHLLSFLLVVRALLPATVVTYFLVISDSVESSCS